MTQLYAFTVSVRSLRPQTVYGRPAAPCRAARATRRRRFRTGVRRTEPQHSPWRLMIPVPDGGRPCGAILSTQPLISPSSSPSSVRQRYPSAPPSTPHRATTAGQRRDRRAARAARPRESRRGALEDPGRVAQARLPGQRIHDPPGPQGTAHHARDGTAHRHDVAAVPVDRRVTIPAFSSRSGLSGITGPIIITGRQHRPSPDPGTGTRRRREPGGWPALPRRVSRLPAARSKRGAPHHQPRRLSPATEVPGPGRTREPRARRPRAPPERSDLRSTTVRSIWLPGPPTGVAHSDSPARSRALSRLGRSCGPAETRR